MALKKPLLVLNKRKAVGGEEPGLELEVIGIIRHKILFKSRPKALISSKKIFLPLDFRMTIFAWLSV